jgi:hypothetical protein
MPTVPGQEMEADSHAHPPQPRLPATQGQDWVSRTESSRDLTSFSTKHSLQVYPNVIVLAVFSDEYVQ